MNNIENILRDEYLGIGAIGKFAIVSMWDDFANNRYQDGILEDQATDVFEIGLILCRLTEEIVASGKCEQMIDGRGQWVNI